jgi:hypothetical protein
MGAYLIDGLNTVFHLGLPCFRNLPTVSYLTKNRSFQIREILLSSGKRVGRHFSSTIYCVLFNMRRWAESRNPVNVPRPETFSTERSITDRRMQLSESNGYINTLVEKRCGLEKIRITTIKY